MYAKGMTTGGIESHIQDICGISVSDSTISRITDKILPGKRLGSMTTSERFYIEPEKRVKRQGEELTGQGAKEYGCM